MSAAESKGRGSVTLTIRVVKTDGRVIEHEAQAEAIELLNHITEDTDSHGSSDLD